MLKKISNYIITFCLLFFIGLILIKCQKPEEIWNNIVSIEDIIGEWEKITSSEDNLEPPESSVIMPIRTFIFSKDNDNNLIFEIKTDYEPFIDYIIEYNLTTDGYTKDFWWNDFVESRKHHGSIFEKYCVRTIYVLPYDENKKFGYDYRNNDYFDNYYINQFGNKIKLVTRVDDYYYVENFYNKK
jgi:hypothetical protein